MATDPQSLLDEASCYQCYAASPQMLLLMELALLAQIVAAGGGGGGGGSTNTNLLYDDVAALPAAPSDVSLVWVASFRDGADSQVWDPDAAAWI